MDININVNVNFNKNFKKIKLNLILIGIVTLAAILRFYNLDFQSPWLDEITTMQLSDPTIPLSKTNELIATRDAFSEVYYYPLKFLTYIFGHSIYVLRFFSAFFGVASVYLIYLFVKELINKKTAYIATILMAVNFFHIYYSQEARSYSLLLFFILLASYRLIKFIKNRNITNAIILGITIGLIPSAHPLGILNIFTIALFMLIYFFIDTNKTEKIKLLKLYLISGVSSLFVIFPALSIIFRVSKISSFWVADPTFESIKFTFFEILGKDNFLFYLYIIGVVAFFVLFFINKDDKNKPKNKYLHLFIIIWITMNIGLIIAKSYLQVSIIQSRYFIGSLPIFIIALAYVLSSIKSKKISYFLVVLLILFSLYNLVFSKKYYATVTKSEWRAVSQEIIKRNDKKEKIIGTFGYVLNGLYVNSNSANLGWEISFEDYISKLKANAIKKESFWYMDGNFKPFSLNQEDIDFLNEHYVIDYQIDKYDCWAKHYSLKSETREAVDKIYLNDFDVDNFDPLGNLYIFENKTIKSKEVTLEKGEYELILEANSLPEVPIDNVNAHIIIKQNENPISQIFLSEKKELSKKVIKFMNNEEKSVFSITFDNDLARNNKDRNVVIYNLSFKKL
jgi:uncharacterized membrane protein